MSDVRHVLVLPDRDAAEEVVEALSERFGVDEEPQVVRDALAGTVPVIDAGSMDAAVERGFEAAGDDGVVVLAPACSSLMIVVASYGGAKESRMREDAVVRMPRTHMLSLTAIGTPASGPSALPDARRRSISAARSRARSSVTRLNAFRDVLRRAMRSSACRQISTADTRPAAMSPAIARAFAKRSLIR